MNPYGGTTGSGHTSAAPNLDWPKLTAWALALVVCAAGWTGLVVGADILTSALV